MDMTKNRSTSTRQNEVFVELFLKNGVGKEGRVTGACGAEAIIKKPKQAEPKDSACASSKYTYFV